ncbi:MAG TPA: STAS domain-containing protein [Fibrobacteria bacterium]|nr:STAS domain-containing protein [Fibrobacteria bacterium]
MELRITSNEKIALFIVKGKIGWENSRILDTQIHKMVEKGCSHIIFNLDEVTFLCSGGIGALVYNMKKVQETGGDIYVVSTSDYIQFLFATIGFNIIFSGRIFKSFEEFGDKVLQPKGLALNLFNAGSTVINTEEHRFQDGAAKNAA